MQERNDAIAIYKAAVDAVQPARLLPEYVQFRNNELYISDRYIQLTNQQHIYIIGAGKAAAAMAQVTEQILGKIITGRFYCYKVQSCVTVTNNKPHGSCTPGTG